jgi:hypothetical protein
MIPRVRDLVARIEGQVPLLQWVAQTPDFGVNPNPLIPAATPDFGGSGGSLQNMNQNAGFGAGYSGGGGYGSSSRGGSNMADMVVGLAASVAGGSSAGGSHTHNSRPSATRTTTGVPYGTAPEPRRHAGTSLGIGPPPKRRVAVVKRVKHRSKEISMVEFEKAPPASTPNVLTAAIQAAPAAASEAAAKMGGIVIKAVGPQIANRIKMLFGKSNNSEVGEELQRQYMSEEARRRHYKEPELETDLRIGAGSSFGILCGPAEELAYFEQALQFQQIEFETIDLLWINSIMLFNKVGQAEAKTHMKLEVTRTPTIGNFIGNSSSSAPASSSSSNSISSLSSTASVATPTTEHIDFPIAQHPNIIRSLQYVGRVHGEGEGIQRKKSQN